MSNFIRKAKKVITTDTDLYLNLLVDDTKIKDLPPKKLTVVNESTSEDDEHVVDELNLEGNNNNNNLKFQGTEKQEDGASGGGNGNGNGNENGDDEDNSSEYTDETRTSGSSRSKKSSKGANGGGNVVNGGKMEDVQNNVYEIPFEQLPAQQQRLKRLEKFMQLKFIKEKFNISLSKEYTINSDYNEMVAEIEFHTNYHKRRNGIEFWKSTFVYGAKGCEYMNKMFDPFGFDLNGWGDHFSAIDANSNEEIFGELYDKYKSRFDGYSVEFRAILMFAGSAGAFVTANSISNVPGMNKIKESNPDLFNKIRSNVANVTKSKIAEFAPSNQRKEINEQHEMYQKMVQEKRQMEQAMESQRREMERMQENQQRIIAQQQSENAELKSKMAVSNVGGMSGSFGAQSPNRVNGSATRIDNPTRNEGGGGLASFGGLAGLARNLGLGSQPTNGGGILKKDPPSTAPSRGNLNDILNKLKQNLPKNDEASSVAEENTSDRRILMSSTVDSDKIKGKASLKGKKSVLNVRR
jgi:hypothetical protein